MKATYKKEGGAFPDPIVNLNWDYAIADVADADRARPRDQRLHGRRRRRTSTGTTLPGRPAARRLRPAQGRRHHRLRLLDLLGLLHREGQHHGPPGQHRSRRPRHRAELGLRVAGQPARPLQPRLVRPGGASRGRRRRSSSSGTASSGSASTCRITASTVAPDKGVGPFILNQEGVARLWTRGLMRDGPFPTHYEPFESPMANLAVPEDQGQPGVPDLQGRPGRPRRPRRSSPTRRRATG